MFHFSLPTSPYEIFACLLQIGADRLNNTKQIQHRVQQSEHLRNQSDSLAFININDKLLQQYLHQEKQRIESDTALIEQLVNNKSKTHIMAFYHLSLKLITLWIPNFCAKLSQSGEISEVADLYSQFFQLTSMTHRFQQIQAIKKNNLYDKIPFVSLLAKWLNEFCRAQFTRSFASLYEIISQLKSQQVPNDVPIQKNPIKQSMQDLLQVSASPRRIPIMRPSSSFSTKTRSISSTINNNNFIKPKKLSISNASTRPISVLQDVLEIDVAHYSANAQKKKDQLFNLLWNKNAGVRNTSDKYSKTRKFKAIFFSPTQKKQRLQQDLSVQ